MEDSSKPSTKRSNNPIDESYDEYADRRWQEMKSAGREGRLGKLGRKTVSQIVAMIRAEYNKRLH